MSSKILQLTAVSHDLSQTEKITIFISFYYSQTSLKMVLGEKSCLFCELVNQVIQQSTEES